MRAAFARMDSLRRNNVVAGQLGASAALSFRVSGNSKKRRTWWRSNSLKTSAQMHLNACAVVP